uniref:Lysosomal dipeptide transporter MFSD1 n=2 Tax=Cacopsylla melanoneura TaxID=428564 RepID=A0A8D9ENK9_9HEMI
MDDQTLFNEGSRANVYPPRRSTSVRWTHPSHCFQRMVALLLMCLLGFGSYFCYDNPASLEDHFMEDMHLSTALYANLYTWYSWPNVICCFIGGFLIDSVFGIRLGTSLYSILVVIGQIVFALGAYMDSLYIAILGRFIFGIGGESLAVAQNSYAVLWFKGKELNMVFGFQLSLSRVGSTVNMFVVEPMYDYVAKMGYPGYETLGIVLLLAGITCLLSLLCALLLGCLDKRAERILNRVESTNTEVVRLSDVTQFPLSFWMVVIIIVAYYASIFPFVSLAKKLFMTRFNLTSDEANAVNSIVYTISAVLSPIMGLIVDKTGRNLFWVFSSLLLSLLCHYMIGLTMVNPHITMVMMGVAYSMIASALWPLIALVIPEYQLGTAYGIAQAVENLGLALVTALGGKIVDLYGYLVLEGFFMSNLGVAVTCIICLWIYDNGRLGLLNMTAGQRSIHDANKLAAESIEREPMLQDSDTEAVVSEHPGFSTHSINSREEDR